MTALSPKTVKGLNAAINLERAKVRAARDAEEGYAAAANFVVNVALAAFNYAASVEGITGFQASWASLLIFAELRGLKGPFAIVSADRMLYPQHDLPTEEARQHEQAWRPWLAKEAARLMAESDRGEVHPTVWAHWEMLAAYTPTPADIEDGTNGS